MSEMMIVAAAGNTTNAGATNTNTGTATAANTGNAANAGAAAANTATAANTAPAASTTVQQEPRKNPPKGQSTSSMLSMWVPFILIFVVMIFFMNRSQKKQMQKRQEMMDKIAKGTKVLLTSGIYGVVDAVHDDAMTVEIASGVKIKVAKAGIADVVTDAENGKTEGK